MNENKILKPLSYILKPLFDYYKYLNFNKILSVKGVDESNVHIFGRPAEKDILYVLKLESKNNHFESLDFIKIKTALRHSKDSQLTYYFIKNKNFQIGYIATFSKEVAQTISDKSNIPILGATDTIQFLLDIYSVTEYYPNIKSLTVEPTVTAQRMNQDDIIDSMQYNLSTILEEGAYLLDEKFKLFQTVKFNNKSDFAYTKIFANFEGILQIAIDLSDSGTEFIINKSVSYASILDRKKLPDFKKLSDEHKMGKVNAIVCNAVILCNSTRDAHNTASGLGMEIIEKKLNKLQIISKSMMLTRELDYDALLPINYVDKIIGIKNKKTLTNVDIKHLNSDKSWVDIKIDFNGRDLFDAPTNFCFRANENPHAVMIADTGTGKSVALQKIVQSILRFDIDNMEIDRFKEVKTRYFEIGGSSSKMLQAIKSLYPNDVGIIEGTLGAMRFSVTDIKLTNEEEGGTMANTLLPQLDIDSLSMSNELINVILEESREQGLSASEEAVFNISIKKVYKEKKYKCKTLGELQDISVESYGAFIQEAYDKGYKPTTRTDEINNVYDVGKFQKPSIDDVMLEVNRASNRSDIPDIDKQIHQSLYLKLKAVREAQTGIFGALSSLTFNDKQFYSFEFGRLSEKASLLRIVFIFLFTTVYSKDIATAVKAKKEGRIMPQTLYLFEESKNFIHGNKSIARMLERIVYEGRKFQIQALFIAQRIDHIPMNIVEACSTFFFLMPSGKEQRSSLTRDIKSLYPKLATVDYLLDNIEFRSLGIISSTGVSSCKFELTRKELEMFAN